MRDYVTPFVAVLVGAATGFYTFQPLILEQLKKDNNLNPKYLAEEQAAEETFGDLTQKQQAVPPTQTEGSTKKPEQGK